MKGFNALLIMNSKICFVSGHYPKGVFFTDLTKRLLVNYCNLNDYDLYYDDFTKVDHVISEFHFRRCLIIKKASEAFPNADWYIWLDTDIYIKTPEKRIESFIDLNQSNILYHLFHEKPWEYPINTGVKIVSKNALKIEDEIYSMRMGCPFPYEQKIMVDYVLPKYNNQIIIHDPENLNSIYRIHDNTNALFIHVCNTSELDRNLIILNKTRHFFKQNPIIRQSKYYKYYYGFIFLSKYQKLKRKTIRFKILIMNGKFKHILNIMSNKFKRLN